MWRFCCRLRCWHRRGPLPFGAGCMVIRRGTGGGGGIWAAEAAWQAWLARERQAEALRRLKNAEQQYAGAIKAQQEGKTWLAATLYMRGALARPKNRHSAEARQALAALAVEGRTEMKKADELFEKGEVEEASKQLDALASGYANVPRFNHEIVLTVKSSVLFVVPGPISARQRNQGSLGKLRRFGRPFRLLLLCDSRIDRW